MTWQIWGNFERITGLWDAEKSISGKPDAFLVAGEGDFEVNDATNAIFNDELEGDDNDAEAEILIGMLLMEYTRRAENLCASYDQVPTFGDSSSEDSPPTPMQWKGDRFWRVCLSLLFHLFSTAAIGGPSTKRDL
ncbi:hypothetical protein FRC11_006969 [Ceratobasidium sp. 423]|nr:hypothetical protein FRC11_006969 [Ceratobasidium sp. 423]